LKSHESAFLLELFTEIYIDSCDRCDALQPQERDLETLRSRVEKEGLSFLTITLPTLGQDLERSLELGYIDPTLFRSFRKRGKIPAFLQGFFGRIFDMWSGRVYEYPRIDLCSIECIRQLAYVFKKIRVPCTSERNARAVAEYKQSELDLRVQVNHERQEFFNSVCNVLWPSVVWGINPINAVPRHGPGSTAEGIQSNRKYIPQRWHDRLEGYFPLLSTAFHNENAVDSEDFKNVTIVESEQEQPVRVVLVPKTLKTPRVIAIEPVCMQYAQQAISAQLVKALQTSELTRGHINFDDQTVNQRIAMRSSIDRRSATLDLSSASDRVPLYLARMMFQSNPDLQGSIEACRSNSAELPTGEIISPLLKFASMGSALCFPVESMYFYTVCVGALLEKYGLPVTFLNARWAARKVYIYGDDIIVPVDDASFIASYLQEYHCKVNTSKSFWKGNFRESCGVEAIYGYDVTPTYLRELPPGNKRCAGAFVSYVATSNLLYKRGFWRSASLIKKFIEKIFGKLPIIKDTSPAIGWVSFQNVFSSHRWNKTLHRPEVWSWSVRPVYRRDPIEGYPALLKCLLSLERRGNSPSEVRKDHLEKSARYRTVALKRGWSTPF